MMGKIFIEISFDFGFFDNDTLRYTWVNKYLIF